MNLQIDIFGKEIMKTIKILDLFSGTQSVRKALEKEYEIEYIGLDIYSPEQPNTIFDLTQDDIVEKLLKILPKDWKPDFIWASPSCQTWSIAAISHHWKIETNEKKEIVKRIPFSKDAILGLKMVENTKKIIDYFGVNFAIENPRGTLRKHPIFQNYFLDTAMYCQYGDNRMKPTDIWSNKPLSLKKCKNGNKDHISAPRGAKTGTQGLKGMAERSKVPPLLIKEIFIQLFEKEGK